MTRTDVCATASRSPAPRSVASGTRFPACISLGNGQRQPVQRRRHLPRRTERGTEADGDAAARAGSGEISAEKNSAENNSVETVSVLLAVVVTAIVSLLLWVAAAG